ncbi:MAG: hypothetical protein VZQ55_04815 [Ruminococcus sp.]|nr:hypothetical protein [Ruminococcus sp.]
MKRITVLFLTAALLFSIGIITSCSGDNKKVTESKTISTKEPEFTSKTALKSAITYIVAKYAGLTKSEAENKINYKMLPSDDNNIYFMRFKLNKIKDDLLVFKSGKVLSLNSDKDSFKKYKDKFSVNIIGISDKEILNQPDVVNGGFGAEFDV